jgi:hypothetical protein
VLTLRRYRTLIKTRNAYVSSSTMKFSPDALVSAGITEKGVVICNFMFGSDLQEPKAHCVRIFPPGQHGNQRAMDDVTLQYPILQDKNFDVRAIVFHAQGFITQLSQVKDMYRSHLVPYKLFGCTLQGGPSLLWGQIMTEFNEDTTRSIDCDIKNEIALWIGRVSSPQDQSHFYHGLKSVKKPCAFNVLQWKTWFETFFNVHLTLLPGPLKKPPEQELCDLYFCTFPDAWKTAWFA